MEYEDGSGSRASSGSFESIRSDGLAMAKDDWMEKSGACLYCVPDKPHFVLSYAFFQDIRIGSTEGEAARWHFGKMSTGNRRWDKVQRLSRA